MAASLAENVKVVEISSIKGRGLVANQSFELGDVLFEEKPLVCAQFSWNELYKYLACEFCMKSLESTEDMVRRLTTDPGFSLPHPECCDIDPTKFEECPQCRVLYCSSLCRDTAAEQYHTVLCKGSSRDDPEHPLNKLDQEWRSFHYPPETASIMLIAKMIAMVKQAKDKEAVLSRFSKFVKNAVNEQDHIAHKLLGEQFQVQREILRDLLMKALYEESVQEWFTPEGFSLLFALIGTNGQGIGSSSFSTWVKNTDSLQLNDHDHNELHGTIRNIYDKIDEVSGEFLDCEGSGLYQLQSACNHSCVPNAEVTFPHGDSTLVMVALRDIAPEEEITISYLGFCELSRSRHSRQKALRENYLFQCTCDKCLSQADDASVTSEDEEEEEDEEMDNGD